MIDRTVLELIYLMGCAVNKLAPEPEVVARIDQEALKKLAKRQALSGTCGYALGLAEGGSSEYWQNAYLSIFRRSLMFETERTVILAQLEQEGIWYLPLKGVPIEKMYPERGIREMADNDILVDADRMQDLRRLMEARGYEVKEGSHDIECMKAPMFNFEMHYRLFDEATDTFEKYFRDISRFFLKAPETAANGQIFERTMSRENMYIYVSAHGYKHFSNSGHGIRGLLDNYVIRKYFAANPEGPCGMRSVSDNAAGLDLNYVDGELEKLEIAAYDRGFRELSDLLFSNPYRLFEIAETLTPEQEEIVNYMTGSSMYGSLQTGVQHRLEKLAAEQGEEKVTGKTKSVFLARKIFPAYKDMCLIFPVLRKWPILLPFMYIWRIIRMLFSKKRRTHAKATLDTVNKL